MVCVYCVCVFVCVEVCVLLSCEFVVVCLIECVLVHMSCMVCIYDMYIFLYRTYTCL